MRSRIGIQRTSRSGFRAGYRSLTPPEKASNQDADRSSARGAGERTAFEGFVRDITARKRQEEALRASESMLRLITDNVPALIGYFDDGAQCQFAGQVLQ